MAVFGGRGSVREALEVLFCFFLPLLLLLRRRPFTTWETFALLLRSFVRPVLRCASAFRLHLDPLHLVNQLDASALPRRRHPRSSLP